MINVIKLSGLAGPPCKYKMIGFLTSIPLIKTYCCYPFISTYIFSSIPETASILYILLFLIPIFTILIFVFTKLCLISFSSINSIFSRIPQHRFFFNKLSQLLANVSHSTLCEQALQLKKFRCYNIRHNT